MFVRNSFELVSRCYENAQRLLDEESLKEAFIQYVFGEYQQEILQHYDQEVFYEHLNSIQLANCRKDFDIAVERWYNLHYGSVLSEGIYHDDLFSLVKEVITTYNTTSRDHLISSFTGFLTSPKGLMARWMQETKRSVSAYFQYVTKLGIHSYTDIEALIDIWLIENPATFDKTQQEYYAKPSRRGRPNNIELTRLMEQAHEVKPVLAPEDKERIRKIYYYHRKTLSSIAMLEKFRKYVLMKANPLKAKKLPSASDSIQVG